MNTSKWLAGVILALVAAGNVQQVAAQGRTLSKFAGYRSVDADPQAVYRLKESNGPWLIMAASFAGPTAQEEAQKLVLEFRKRYKWSAYLHSMHFDFSGNVEGKGINKYGDPLQMKYRQASEFDEIAVLVGDFPTVDDPVLQSTLAKIKRCQPSALTNQGGEGVQSLRYAGLRNLFRKVTHSSESGKLGPLSKCFVTRNPMLPQEYFTPRGIDAFVQEINRGVKYNLLDCPASYSVKVATFRGNVVIDPKEIQRIQETGRMEHRLTQAAEKAHALTKALRDRGVEAYEFHDRSESIVTVGSFSSVGEKQSDGKIELDPRVLKVMQSFGARQTSATVAGAPGMKPRSLNGIHFDLQPVPVEIPRRSIAADYSRRR